MKFVRKNINNKQYIDSVFLVSSQAKKDSDGIDATVGCLCNEDGSIFTFDTVYNNEKNISNINNASYANPVGNQVFLNTIKDFVLDKHITINNQILATAGGTGAIYAGVKSCLDEKETIILPEIAWGNYSVMADELNLNVVNYDIYDINSLLKAIDKVSGKVFVVINSPCHNPCGMSYTYDEWKIIIDKINTCGKEVVLLNDIAYADYSFNDSKKYFDLFNTINDNVLVLIAYSCSKSFSYYGKRVGALIAINKDEDFLKMYINFCTRIARTTWSNVNNGAMQNIADVLRNHYSDYIKEKDKAISLIRKRAELFLSQAKECNLEFYPYKEGYFVTIKTEDQNLRDAIHQRLIDNHIYTVKVKKGLRIGLCSLSLKSIDGLAKKIKSLY